MHGLWHSSTFLIPSGIPDSKFSLCAQSSSDACSVSPLTSRARPELCRGRWRQPNKEGLELRMQGMNSHPGRSLGSIPTSQERPRFQLKISLWKAYCSFSHCSQQFGSHLVEEEKEFADRSQQALSQTDSPALPRGRGGCVQTLHPLRYPSFLGTGSSFCASRNWQRWRRSHSKGAL